MYENLVGEFSAMDFKDPVTIKTHVTVGLAQISLCMWIDALLCVDQACYTPYSVHIHE